MKIQDKDITYVQPPPAAASGRESSSTSDRRELFTALVESCGWNPSEITRSARGAVNRAVAELVDVGATAAEVARRAGHYRKRWPAVSITPSALAKHWAELAEAPPVVDENRAMYERVNQQENERNEVDLPRRDLIVRLVEASNAGDLSPDRYRELNALAEGVTTWAGLAEATEAVDSALAEDFS